MKVFVMANNYAPSGEGRDRGWFLLADSAVINTGKPFYLPDSVGKTIARFGIALKISRLGKSVSNKFAKRYFSEYAPVINFNLPDYEKELKAKDLPADPARNFDKALVVGDFRPIEQFKPLTMQVNGTQKGEFITENLILPFEEIICVVSRYNTLKMGDIVVAGLTGETELNEGDLIELMESGGRLFHVRVK